MKAKRVLMSSLLAAAAMSGMMTGMEEARAQSSSEELEPIVYFLVDTSNSMNAIMTSSGVDNNNTRLTKALGEIAGASQNYDHARKLLRDTSGTTNFKIPYKTWQYTTGGYKYVSNFKQIGPNSKAAYPNTRSDDPNSPEYENSYSDDGIIQTYKDKVKFGFAGFAVGTAGDEDKSVFEEAREELKAKTGELLTFTLRWGYDRQSCSDIDLHAYIYRNGREIEHIYYGDMTSSYGYDYGFLDLDNRNPNSENCSTNRGTTCSRVENGIKVGYENIYWDKADYFQDGDIVEMLIHNYSICGSESGFQTEISFYDDYGCTVSNVFKYNGSMPGHSTRNYREGRVVAKVRYDGVNKKFVLDETPIEPDTSERANKPENIYGLSMYENGGVKYGKIITDDYKKGRNCEFNMGIWDSVGPWNMHNTNDKGKTVMDAIPAPLNYPTAYNSPEKIEASNAAIVTNVRSYVATSATPIGESLADLYHLFGVATAPNFKASADEGVFRQPNGTSTPQEDEYYNCRPKAVVLITDGGPKGSGYDDSTRVEDENVRGHAEKVWHDAWHLYEQKIKVFPVGYAEFQLTEDEKSIDVKTHPNKKDPVYISKMEKLVAIDTLNKVAWKGGTCRHPTKYVLVSPTDEALFNDFNDKIYDDTVPLDKKICFSNAEDSDALRAALVTALSEMLQGDYSKTKIVNSGVIGANSNYDSGRKSTNHGYYSVYSGYRSSLAPIRKAKLQREATVCNHSTGKFHNDERQFLDLAQRLQCRLTSCNLWRAATKEDQDRDTSKIIGMNYEFTEDSHGKSYTERAGYAGMSDGSLTHCAKVNSEYELPSSDANKNICLSERYIFSGKYNSSGDTGDRYAISTFPRSGNVDSTGGTILKNVGISNDEFGIIPNAKGSKARHFLTNSNDPTCKNIRRSTDSSSSEYSKGIYSQISNVNYLVSPYECFDDMDCGISGITKKLRHCDLGRCVDVSTINSCVSNSYVSANEVCINNEVRHKSNECSNHTYCNEGQVCHAGRCVSGVVKNCDIRQFIATQPLGIIEYATPVTVTPPSRPYRSSDYIQFASKYKQRDIMLMVGANDGMLHSFILGDNDTPGDGADHSAGGYEGAAFDRTIYNIKDMPDYHATVSAGNKEGDELWAFIPKLLMPKLSSLVKHDHGTSYINGTPVVSDVRLPGFTINGDAWRTVLVGGFRNGGRGYYALDITDPGHPFVLWEIDNQWQPEGASEHKEMGKIDGNVTSANSAYPFDMMGYSYAEPVITKMLINNVPEPVVILSGGMPESGNSASDLTGKVMYIVRLFPSSKNDLIVKTFYFDNPITGSPSVYPNNFNSTAEFVYVGDSRGKLYRLDVTGSDTSQWGADERLSNGVEMPIFDPKELGAGPVTPVFSPITFPPAVSLYDTIGGKPVIQVAFGTGSNDSFYVDKNDNHYFASFLDVPVTEDGDTKYVLNKEYGAFKPSVIILNASDNLNISDREPNEVMNYKVYYSQDRYGKPIPKGQKLTGAPITYNYSTYFPTFMVSDDRSDAYCPVGGAAIWRVDSEGDENSKRITNLMGADALQRNGVTNNPFFDDGGGIRSFYELNEGTKIFGLEITNMQYCANSDYSGASYSVPPQLIAQTSADSDDEYSMTSNQRSSELKGSVSTDVPAIAIELEAIAPVMTPSVWMSVYE